MLNHIDKIIGESIEVEEHPDRRKTKGERDNYSINRDTLMHRFYGVVKVDGKYYSVMTLMRENKNPNEGNGFYSYEVINVEVSNEYSPDTSIGVGTPNSELEAYPLAKIIEKVGKTMEPGKKLLGEGEKTTESVDGRRSLSREANAQRLDKAEELLEALRERWAEMEPQSSR